MANFPVGGLLNLMLSEGGPSQVTQEESQVKRKVSREWEESSLSYFLNMCEEKYWEYGRKPFRVDNWKAFAAKMCAEFPKDPK